MGGLRLRRWGRGGPFSGFFEGDICGDLLPGRKWHCEAEHVKYEAICRTMSKLSHVAVSDRNITIVTISKLRS